ALPISESGEVWGPLQACATSEEQRSDEENHKDDRQDVCDAARSTSDPRESEYRRDDGDDEKDDCVAKHDEFLHGYCLVRLGATQRMEAEALCTFALTRRSRLVGAASGVLRRRRRFVLDSNAAADGAGGGAHPNVGLSRGLKTTS